MMCHRMGRFPICTMGFGLNSVSSLRRVPRPPQSMTTFINLSPPESLKSGSLHPTYETAELLEVCHTPGIPLWLFYLTSFPLIYLMTLAHLINNHPALRMMSDYPARKQPRSFPLRPE